MIKMTKHLTGDTGSRGLRAGNPLLERPTFTVSRFDGVVTLSESARHLCGGVPLDSPVCVHLLICDDARRDHAGRVGLPAPSNAIV
jgi:hypothetical protein